jgi:hypothetical protein
MRSYDDSCLPAIEGPFDFFRYRLPYFTYSLYWVDYWALFDNHRVHPVAGQEGQGPVSMPKL